MAKIEGGFKKNEIVWVSVNGGRELAKILSINYLTGQARVVFLEVGLYGHTLEVLSEKEKVVAPIAYLDRFEK